MLKVAAIQMCGGLDRIENVAAAISLIREAATTGAQLIATPEMTNVVDRKPRRLFEHLPFEAELEEITSFSELAKELGITLLIGSMAVALDKDFGNRKAANRTYLFGPDGALLTTYDKIHMFDVDLPGGESWKESSVYTAGQQANVVNTASAKIGLSICYDLRFPHLYRALAQAGAQILMVPAAFTAQTGHAHWEPLLRARAIETGSFVIAPAQGGHHEDGRTTWGHSMIIDPWGKILAEKADDVPGIVTAEINLEQVDKVRQQVPNLKLDHDITIIHM